MAQFIPQSVGFRGSKGARSAAMSPWKKGERLGPLFFHNIDASGKKGFGGLRLTSGLMKNRVKISAE